MPVSVRARQRAKEGACVCGVYRRSIRFVLSRAGGDARRERTPPTLSLVDFPLTRVLCLTTSWFFSRKRACRAGRWRLCVRVSWPGTLGAAARSAGTKERQTKDARCQNLPCTVIRITNSELAIDRFQPHAVLRWGVDAAHAVCPDNAGLPRALEDVLLRSPSTTDTMY